MPTPSSNPQSLSTLYPVDAVSTHTTCPPETDRIATWRASSEERIVPDADDDASPSTLTRLAQAQLGQQHNTHPQTAPSLGIEISPQTSSQRTDLTDDDVSMESPSPAASVSTEGASSAQTYPTSSSSSTTSSMDYEVSNVRVSRSLLELNFLILLLMGIFFESSSPIIARPSSERAASSSEHSSQTARYTM